MAVKKREYQSGTVVWRYTFDAPGSGRTARRQITASGFATKAEAIDAEAVGIVKARAEYEAGQRVSGGLVNPKTFGELVQLYFAEHAEKNLAMKTVERDRQLAGYVSPTIL